jgi:2-iminobutanoate/2-iminopropanoate deaminase
VKVPFRIRFGPQISMQEAIKTASAPESRGNSQGVRVGSFLFLSGQLPIDRDGNVIKGTVAEEANQALENVRAIVEAASGSMEDIVQCTVYLSDIALWTDANESYLAFFSAASVLPARTVVAVKEMADGARVQIQAIARLKNW